MSKSWLTAMKGLLWRTLQMGKIPELSILKKNANTKCWKECTKTHCVMLGFKGKSQSPSTIAWEWKNSGLVLVKQIN